MSGSPPSRCVFVSPFAFSRTGARFLFLTAAQSMFQTFWGSFQRLGKDPMSGEAKRPMGLMTHHNPPPVLESQGVTALFETLQSTLGQSVMLSGLRQFQG